VPRQFIRFLWVGVGATALHVLVAAHLIGSYLMPAAAGNAIAFVLANLFSYFLHSLYVFDRRPTPDRYWRFLAVSLIVLVLVAVVSAGLEVIGAHYLAGIAAIVLIGPIATFGLHSIWTFREKSPWSA
jgi:putative flippase GtrA